MYALVGMIVVIASILGGFLLEKGNLLVLLQPAELLIIGGAALGTLLIANPIHVVKSVARGLISVLKGSAYTTEFYLESLKLLNDLFNSARRDLLKFEQ